MTIFDFVSGIVIYTCPSPPQGLKLNLRLKPIVTTASISLGSGLNMVTTALLSSSSVW